MPIGPDFREFITFTPDPNSPNCETLSIDVFAIARVALSLLRQDNKRILGWGIKGNNLFFELKDPTRIPLSPSDRKCLIPTHDWDPTFCKPSDGFGYWATYQIYSELHDVHHTLQPEWATHVLWFNK